MQAHPNPNVQAHPKRVNNTGTCLRGAPESAAECWPYHAPNGRRRQDWRDLWFRQRVERTGPPDEPRWAQRRMDMLVLPSVPMSELLWVRRWRSALPHRHVTRPHGIRASVPPPRTHTRARSGGTPTSHGPFHENCCYRFPKRTTYRQGRRMGSHVSCIPNGWTSCKRDRNKGYG